MLGGDNEASLDQRLKALNQDFDKAAVLSSAPNYEQAECGWVHPNNTSMMKIRDNGCIDIFGGTDNGLRIDPNKKSINVIASHMKEHIGDLHSWISDFSITDVKGPWTLNAINVFINAKKSINLTAGTTINFKADKITGRANRYDFD